MQRVDWTEATDLERGVAMARQVRPDLILIHLRAPFEGAFRLLAELRDDPFTGSIPVIGLMSVAGLAEVKAAAIDLGACDVIDPPIEPVEVGARIRSALRTKDFHDLMERRANHDGLTGLANRHAFEERLRSACAWAPGRGGPVGLILADLDRFKSLNDRYGHLAGDEVLRRAAGCLRSAVRAVDFVARYGGEEFVAIVEGCDLAGVFAIAERFRSRLASTPIVDARGTIRVTASVGVSAEPAGSVEPSVLLTSADRALYIAKANGRNRVQSWAGTAGLESRPAPSSRV